MRTYIFLLACVASNWACGSGTPARAPAAPAPTIAAPAAAQTSTGEPTAPAPAESAPAQAESTPTPPDSAAPEPDAGLTIGPPIPSASSTKVELSRRRIQLPGLGVEGNVPESFEREGALGEYGRLLDFGEYFVFVARAERPVPTTLDEAKKKAQYNSAEELKVEQLPDGFALTFMSPRTKILAPKWHVFVLRTIAGAPIWCESSPPEPGQRDVSRAFCLGLRPLAAR